MVFTIEKYPRISGPLQVTPTLFKGQLFLLWGWCYARQKSTWPQSSRARRSGLTLAVWLPQVTAPPPRKGDPGGGNNAGMDVKACVGIVCFKCKVVSSSAFLLVIMFLKYLPVSCQYLAMFLKYLPVSCHSWNIYQYLVGCNIYQYLEEKCVVWQH